MRYSLVLIFSILWSINIFSQNQFNPIIYGETMQSEVGLAVFKLDNEFVYMVGQTNVDIFGDVDISLSKFDNQGNLLWTKYYGTEFQDIVGKAVFDDDQHFVISGYQFENSDGSTDAFLLKVDSSGQEIWNKTYGEEGINETFSGIDFAHDGGLVACGFSSAISGTGNDIYALKTDINGNELWSMAYSTPENDVSYAIQQTPDNSYILAGDRQQAQGFYNVAVLKIAADGQLIWDETVRNPFNGGSKNLIVNSVGNYVVVGEGANAEVSAFEVTLAEFDPEGELLWNTWLPANAEHSDAGFDLMEIGNREYMITGYSFNELNQSSDLVINRVDSMGNELEKYYFGNDMVDIGYDIIPDGDNGFWATGMSIESEGSQYFLLHGTLESLTRVPVVAQRNLSISPNPIHSNQVLSFGEELSNFKLKLIDIQGRIIHQEEISNSINSYTLPKVTGLHMLHLVGDDWQTVIKLMIIK